MSLDKEVPSSLVNCSLNLEIHQPVQQLPKSPNIDYFNSKYRKWFLEPKQHLESECECFERKLYVSTPMFKCLFSFSVKITYALSCLSLVFSLLRRLERLVRSLSSQLSSFLAKHLTNIKPASKIPHRTFLSNH